MNSVAARYAAPRMIIKEFPLPSQAGPVNLLLPLEWTFLGLVNRDGQCFLQAGGFTGASVSASFQLQAAGVPFEANGFGLHDHLGSFVSSVHYGKTLHLFGPRRAPMGGKRQ